MYFQTKIGNSEGEGGSQLWNSECMGGVTHFGIYEGKGGLPPFSLIRDFGKQNTHGNVSKISVSLACYRQIGSKSTNYSH